ncbi:family 43 glycosylhydrolase [Paenibacillus sp. YIM B09110]|uniref:family 43 glycosylhydrolase n=1 Tax=Paenibacillus sp. YIM B09110 TaxID=3126102 RepID=UPI00301E24B0
MARSGTIDNSQIWHDNDGNAIHAHGGGFLQEGDYYYWFGESRQGSKKVACYRSTDMEHWEFRNHVLSVDSAFQSVYYRTFSEMDPYGTIDKGYGSGSVIERPKVLHNAFTGKYVMWMHWENGRDYLDARCAVATCDTIDGDYDYHGSYNPIGQMSRDCTLFRDDDGTGYFISAARDNADLMIYRLSDDYLSIDEHVKTLWPGQYREAPALFKRGELYFLVTSACTGWYPNQGAYAYASSLTGKWSQLYDLGGPTTYDSQPAFVLTVQGIEHTTYLYVGDRWDPSNYSQSSYVFLPLEFSEDHIMSMDWQDIVTIDTDTGAVGGEYVDSGLYRIYCNGPDQYLAPDARHIAEVEGAVGATKLAYASEDLKWMLVDVGAGKVLIQHAESEGYLQPLGQSDSEGAAIVLAERVGHPSEEWECVTLDQCWCRFLNRHSGLALTISGEKGGKLVQSDRRSTYDTRRGFDSQLFLPAKVY